MNDIEAKKEVAKLLENNKDALYFVGKYVEYVHAIDDIVDEDKNIQTINNAFRLAHEVFNSKYWLVWRTQLAITERLIHNVYFDSCEWEMNKDKWKQRDAKVMNQRGYDMIFAVILIECGEEVLSKFSLKFREYSHLNQGHDI